MDQKHHLQIVGFKTIKYTNKKSGAHEEMKIAQCVVTSESEEKGKQVVVGELVVPKHLHDVQPGSYLAEFELSVGQDLRIGARLSRLHAIGVRQAAKAA